MAREYVLADIDERLGHLNGTVFWRITWVDCQDTSIWETTVDPTYNNFTRSGWNEIVNLPEPWGVYRGLTRSNRVTGSDVGIITADSRPQLVEPMSEIGRAHV